MYKESEILDAEITALLEETVALESQIRRKRRQLEYKRRLAMTNAKHSTKVGLI